MLSISGQISPPQFALYLEFSTAFQTFYLFIPRFLAQPLTMTCGNAGWKTVIYVAGEVSINPTWNSWFCIISMNFMLRTLSRLTGYKASKGMTRQKCFILTTLSAAKVKQGRC